MDSDLLSKWLEVRILIRVYEKKKPGWEKASNLRVPSDPPNKISLGDATGDIQYDHMWMNKKRKQLDTWIRKFMEVMYLLYKEMI